MRLHEEEKAELERMQRERAAQKEASNVALTIEFNDVPARMDADALLAARLQEEENSEMVKDSGKKDDDSQKQAESSKKRSRTTHDEESVKKQKLEDDAEKEEHRACLDIVPGDDIAINVESLATKYPIVDWKTHILTENIMYYQIIRAHGSSKNYKIFSGMLNDFHRQDVVDLYKLVKERVAIHMMIEKKYPLTQEMLSRMLHRRLEVDHESEMALELIRFIKGQLKE
ncbi:hypothetical protein Tco_0169179 [Tanacetum coccineum]